MRRWILAVVALMPWLFTEPALAQVPVTVVNVIPNNLSNETIQNSEPSVAVGLDSNGALRALISAFDLGNAAGNPYYINTMGGAFNTWQIAQSISHFDTTIAWSPGGNVYAAIATVNGTQIQGFRSTPPNPPITLTQLANSLYPVPAAAAGTVDQPRIAVSPNVGGGPDRVYIGFNDTSQGVQSASVSYSLNNGNTWNPSSPSNPPLPIVIDHAAVAGQISDLPAVPVAVSPSSNTVYAAFERSLGPAAAGSADPNVILTVVKDNANGTNNFGDLGPKVNVPNFGMLGVGINPLGGNNSIIAPFGDFVGTPPAPNGTVLGHERLGSDLALAVSPTNPNQVYIAYAEVVNNLSVVRVQESMNGGLTWPTVFTVPGNSGLPALSVAQNGTVGLLDTALAGGNLVTQVWELNGFNLTPYMLAAGHPQLNVSSFPDNMPAFTFQPYIGDYEGLTTLNNQFYGTFSASNDPVANTFPDATSVLFQRNVNVSYLGGLVNQTLSQQDLKNPTPLLGVFPGTVTALRSVAGAPAAVSIDPYFFSLVAVPEPPTLAMAVASLPAGLACLLLRRRHVL
jgi:hypothetical protein